MLPQGNAKGVVLSYQMNTGEAKKIRILYTKNIDLVSALLDNYHDFLQIGWLSPHQLTIPPPAPPRQRESRLRFGKGV